MSATAIDAELFYSVCNLFSESQYHVSSHRKNIQALRKLHDKASKIESGELQFLHAFCHCLHVVLAMKKNDEVSGRLLRFLVGFIVRSADGKSGEFFGRFIEGLMGHVLEHLDVKEKLVRARLCQVMVACLNSVQELTDEVWTIFRVKMTERLFDKEPIVRVHAIHSMARLQSLPVEDDSDLTVLDIFMDLLRHDPSADVRKAALLQIDVNAKSLPVILERRRDTDTSIRKIFFATKLQEVDVLSLSIQQRDEILKAGLADREPSVRQACIEMVLENWIQRTGGNLIQFLVGLDVIANTQVAEMALKSFFEKMPDALSADSFSEQFLLSMTPEMAFILRTFCQSKQVGSKQESIEAIQEILPELSKMAEFVRDKYDSLVACKVDDLLARTEIEFVLNEMLTVCSWLDFSDEVGRRAIFEVIQEMMTNLELGDLVFNTCIKIFNDHSSSVQEFLTVMTEFLASFRDVYEDAKTPKNALERSLESLKLGNEEEDEDIIGDDIKIMANLKALEIVKNVFSNPEISFGKHPVLVAFLDEIVIPSVNSSFAAVQANGLKCLGLCCTVEKNLALEYMPLFVDFFTLGQDEVRVISLQTAFDLILLFGRDFFDGLNSESDSSKSLSTIITMALYDPDEGIQSVAAEGFAKLLLHKIIRDREVLEGLFYLYLHPSTNASDSLKQCLSYFFQAFAFSDRENQQLIASIFVRVFLGWLKNCRELAEESKSSMTPSSVANQLLYLIDPKNLMNSEDFNDSPLMFAGIAVGVGWAALKDPHELGKVLGGLLPKLLSTLPPSSSLPGLSIKLKELVFLVSNLIKYVPDKVTLNSLKKLLTQLVQLDDHDDDDGEEYSATEMRTRLQQVLPLGIKANIVQSAASTSKSTGMAKKPGKSGLAAATNIMDEISDLLDE